MVANSQVVTLICNPNSVEAEAGGSPWVPGEPRLQSETLSWNQLTKATNRRNNQTTNSQTIKNSGEKIFFSFQFIFIFKMIFICVYVCIGVNECHMFGWKPEESQIP